MLFIFNLFSSLLIISSSCFFFTLYYLDWLIAHRNISIFGLLHIYIYIYCLKLLIIFRKNINPHFFFFRSFFSIVYYFCNLYTYIKRKNKNGLLLLCILNFATIINNLFIWIQMTFKWWQENNNFSCFCSNNKNNKKIPFF